MLARSYLVLFSTCIFFSCDLNGDGEKESLRRVGARHGFEMKWVVKGKVNRNILKIQITVDTYRPQNGSCFSKYGTYYFYVAATGLKNMICELVEANVRVTNGNVRDFPCRRFVA